MKPIDISPEDLKTVRAILRRHLPDIEVRAFGSRVRWTARGSSDLDLALMTEASIDAGSMADLREAFVESDLPFKVDIVDWATTSGEFRRVIEEEFVVVQEEGMQGVEGVEWRDLPVSEVCDIFLGGTPKRSEASYWDGSIKWASAKDVAACSSRYLTSTEETITRKGVEESAAKLLGKDTIVITARGTVGALCMLSEPMSFNQTCYGLVAKTEILPRYLYYALKAVLSQIRSLSYGTVFDTITMKSFKDLNVPLPPLSEQRAIAHILGSLDDKIELNRRMNETLEAMARAIFKSWFVDFDPVYENMKRKGAKAQRRKEKEDRLSASLRHGVPALNQEIFDLFPDSFVESELGEMPDGWKQSTIHDEFDLTMGQSPPGDTYNETGDGLPFFQGRRDFGFRYPKNRVYCTAPKRIAEHSDTLVSVRAPVGAINMAADRCCIGRGVAGIRHKSGSRSYTYYAMHTLGDNFARFEAEGTVFGAINKNQFEAIMWIAPPTLLVEIFEQIAFPFDERIESNEQESAILATIRDTLLPKLLSGELCVLAVAMELAAQADVADAEKFVEETEV